MLKFREDTPNRIRIKSKYKTINIHKNGTQTYIKRLQRYDEVKPYIYDDGEVEEVQEEVEVEDKVDNFDDMKMSELRELYPHIKAVKKEDFINQIHEQFRQIKEENK